MRFRRAARVCWLGVALHLLIVAALSAYMPLQLPLPGVKPLLVGAVSGFVCLAAFALPPVMALKSISPMRVIRRDLDAPAYRAG